MNPQLEHRQIKIKNLIEDYRSGKIVIPEFQRDYVWKPSRAPLLIDSLYKGYPISSLLLWQSTDSVLSRPGTPSSARTSQVNWLIDGQQRVRTLEKILAVEEIEVVFNADRDEFRLANAATRNDTRNWIRVADIWDEQTYLLIRRSLDSGGYHDKREAKFEAIRDILNYEVPAVCMVNHSFDAAVDAFTRINTLGTRLKKEDIESAQIAAKHTGFIANEVVPFLTGLHARGFSRVNIMHLFRACAFVASADGRSKVSLHELGAKEIRAAWKITEAATEQVIGLVRSELGLLNMDILWSGSLFVPLIAICSKQKARERDVPGMMGWLALAALGHRYSGASETSLDQDLRACRASEPIDALLKNLRQSRASLKAQPSDFGGAINDRSGLLALYIACKHRGMLDFFGGAKIISQGNLNRHHILPRGQFRESERHQSDVLANIAFISGGVNKALGLTGPEIYLKTVKPKILQSQCVPCDEKLWRIDASEEFWEQRRISLADAFNDFLRVALPRKRL